MKYHIRNMRFLKCKSLQEIGAFDSIRREKTGIPFAGEKY
jgi:hypothetical protein